MDKIGFSATSDPTQPRGFLDDQFIVGPNNGYGEGVKTGATLAENIGRMDTHSFSSWTIGASPLSRLVFIFLHRFFAFTLTDSYRRYQPVESHYLR